jgi:hypothetical protein
VVVGGDLADHREDGVGVALVVGRHVGEALDLPHDVVAQVADHAAVQRGQLGDGGRPVGGEQPVDRRQHPPVEGDALGQASLDLDAARPGDQGGRGIAAHERPPAPALAVLHRLEQEAGLVAHHPQEAGHGGGEVAQDLPPHRHHGGSAGQGAEDVPTGLEHRSGGRSR